MRDSLRIMEERERMREAKLEALRRDIAAGLESGPVEPLDMQEDKADARKQQKALRHGT